MTVFAHQGGWDEMLLVAAPIALLAFILWLANRRATRLRDERSRTGASTTSTTTSTPSPSPVDAGPADDDTST